jgi:hypothetical protein
MSVTKHITIDVADLNVLRITCAACQASFVVPLTPDYQPQQRCPNPGCLATWFVPKSPSALIEHYVTGFAKLRKTMKDMPVRVPASDLVCLAPQSWYTARPTSTQRPRAPSGNNF